MTWPSGTSGRFCTMAATGFRTMSSQIAHESAWTIVVFYPANSLMHQVSHWAIRYPAYDFTLCFARSLPEIQNALPRAAISIVDATEDPVRAMAAFTQALSALEADCVTVYTETMYEGLELFVRIRGVPLLLGPISDAPWEEQLKKMLQSAGRAHPCGFLMQQYTQIDGGIPEAWLRKRRLQTSLTKKLRRLFHERR
jgi:hypothetical protein